MGRRIIRIDGKYYDMGTPNVSFLQVANDLQTLGVEHWYFLLEIKDVSLINVNPHAVDKDGHSTNTKEEVERINTECRFNPWYYLREVARIPAPGRPTGIPYAANRGNIAQAWCILKGIDSWLCLTRQKGKTKSALCIQGWAYSYGTSNTKFIFINKDGENAKINLQDFADQIDILPEYMQFKYVLDEDGKVIKGRNSATKMRHPITKNEIVVTSKAPNPSEAAKKGRGLSAAILHFDEVEFTPFIDVIVGNSVSTFEESAKRSREAGGMAARIFTSTPGDPDTDEGRRGEELLEGTREWKDKMYDWSVEEINEYLYANQKQGIAYIEYSYLQIGLTRAWFKQTAQKIGNDIIVRREILLQRLRGSSNSPYPREDIDHIIAAEAKPIRTVLLQKYYDLVIYEELNRNVPYIVGIDCSTGTVSDSNAMTILNPYTVRPAATFECSYVGETVFEKIIMELVKDYIPRAVLCIERNHVGDSIIDHLLHTPYAGRLYFDKYKEIAEENMKALETRESILKANAKMKTYYGVYTKDKSRDAMFKILANRIRDYQEDFVAHSIIRDIAKLVMKNGKIQAASGAHDDAIMSYNIAMYIRFYGNNLPCFGFDPADLAILDNENQNQGIERAFTFDRSSLPEEVQEFIDVEAKRKDEMSYEERYIQDVTASQARDMKLTRRGLLHNNVYENTPERMDDQFIPEEIDRMDSDFFDEMNHEDEFSLF